MKLSILKKGVVLNENEDKFHYLHQPVFSINRQDREQLNGHKGIVVWLTGLSGSGKSTIANFAVKALHEAGKHTYILDGDKVRGGLCKDMNFSNKDRIENIRRVAEVSKLMMDAGLIVVTAFISPFRNERNMAKELIGSENFLEIYISTPLVVCEQRDPKGLYKLARAGLLQDMTGIDSPYECPETADLKIDLSSNDPQASLQALISAIECKLSN